MLEIKNLKKSYGKSFAVEDVNITINDGEICAFIGHNGAGKTTTIKALVGIMPFDQGEIIFNGLSILDDPIAFKKQIAYIADNPELYEYMTGIKYLNFIGDIFGVETNVRNERITKYAKLFEIENDLASAISSYSHGMKQKLAIISALIHDPKLIVMDEPFVGLDPSSSYTVKQIMKEKCQEGCSFFFSTHILEVAEKLCDQLVIIKNGKIVKSGAMKDFTQNTSLESLYLELEDKNVKAVD